MFFHSLRKKYCRTYNHKKPFFSVVIPTRDRPEIVEISLTILIQQSFKNFEIIVSDNYLTKPCQDVVTKFHDPRIKYVSPESPLEMSQHWEFACSFTKGRYVAVLVDKTFLHTEALDVLFNILFISNFDIINWGSETYVPRDEKNNYLEGYYSPQYKVSEPQEYSPVEELKRRLECDTDLWAEKNFYTRGKICFGVFSSKLITRIIDAQGCLFHSVCPDYTATASALALAENALDLGRPLMVSILTTISNGMNFYNSSQYAFNFLEQITVSDSSQNIFDELPIPGLFTSTHNLIAGDYLRVKRKMGSYLFPHSLNMKNLETRILNDLAVTVFKSNHELESQLQLLISSRKGLVKNSLLTEIEAKRSQNPMRGNLDNLEMRNIYENVYLKFSNPLALAKEMADYYSDESIERRKKERV